jgi:G protein-coupled receptor kinase interacting protein 2
MSTPRKTLSNKDSKTTGLYPKKKPQPQDPLFPVKEDFIKAKYAHLAYINKAAWNDLPNEDFSSATVESNLSDSSNKSSKLQSIIDDLSQQLHSAVRTPNLKVSLRLLASGADVNYSHSEKGDSTPLHVAVNSNQVLQVELLLAFNADPLKRDASGKQAVTTSQELGFNDISDRLMTAPHVVTDRLYVFLTGKRSVTESGPNISYPIGGHSSDKNALQGLTDPVFEELVKDVYDEVDRRETNESLSSLKAMTLVPFLPVNVSLSSTRNQSRQKLATLIRHEFNYLIIDILNEAHRRLEEEAI